MSPTCPRCGQLIQPEDSQDGLTFQCSACAAVLRLRAPLPGFVKPDATEDVPEHDTPPESTDSIDAADTANSTESFDSTAETTEDIAPELQTESTAAADGGYEMLAEEEELELVDETELVTPLELEETTAPEFTDSMHDLTTDGISVDEFPVVEDPIMQESAGDELGDDFTGEPSLDAGLPHVSVPEDAPDTIDFAAAAEDVRDAVEQAAGPTEHSLHEEVSELLDVAEGAKVAGAAALGAAGMSIVGAASDDSDEASDNGDNAPHVDEAEGLADADDDLEFDDVEIEFEFEIPDEDILDDNPELPVEPTNEPAMESTIEAADDPSDETEQDSLDEFEIEAVEQAEDAILVDNLSEDFGAGLELPPTTPLESSSALADEPFELSFDDVDEPGTPDPVSAPTDNVEPPTLEPHTEAVEIIDDAVEEAAEPLAPDEPVELETELTTEPETVEEIDFSASEMPPVQAPSIPPIATPPPVETGEVPELDFEMPELPGAADVPELPLEDAEEPADSLLDDVGAGLTAAAAGAAAIGAAAFTSGDDDAEDAEPENMEIVFDRTDDEPVGDIDLDFEDAARPTFEPDKIDAGDLALEPVDEAVAGLPPAGVPLATNAEKPFEMVSGGGSMAVAPAVPRKRNLLFDLFKLVIGAAVGLSIAQGILWWAMKIDPLGLAHRMPAALAIAVPEELRNNLPPLKPRVTASAEDMPEPLAQNVPDNPTSDASAATNDDIRDSAFGADTDMSDDLADSDSNGGDDGMDNLESDDPMGDLADSRFGETTDDSSTDEKAAEESSPVPFSGYGMVGVAETSPYDLGAALATAREASKTFTSAPSSEKKAASRKLYISFASLADQATTVKRGGDAEQVLNEVRAELDLAANDASMKRVFGKGGNSWIRRDMGRGVVVAGEIKSKDRAGDLQEVQLQLDGTETTVTVVTRDSTLQVGDAAVVLGTLINDPADNLKNYSGLDDKVIWSTDTSSQSSR